MTENMIIECEDCAWYLEEVWIEKGYGETDREEWCMCPDRKGCCTPDYDDWTCKFAEEGEPRREVHYA